MPDMKDLGTVFEPYAEEHDGEKHYPTVHLEDKQVEALGVEGLDVGDERLLMARIKVRSKSAHEGSDEQHTSLAFDLLEGSVYEPSKKSLSERIFGGNDA